MTSPKQSDITGAMVADALQAQGVTHVVTVPDWVQLPLHRALESRPQHIQTINCCTEHEAFMIAGGLHAGGQRGAVVIQQQGLYAGLNALRGIGLDAGLPIVMLIGQFGREAANRGQSTKVSGRRIVRMLEPLLDAIEVPWWAVDGVSDLEKIADAFRTAQERRCPAAIVFDRNMSWRKD